jgi:hypothetical protein
MINGDGQQQQHGLPVCVPRRAVSQMSTRDMGDLKGSETKEGCHGRRTCQSSVPEDEGSPGRRVNDRLMPEGIPCLERCIIVDLIEASQFTSRWQAQVEISFCVMVVVLIQ